MQVLNGRNFINAKEFSNKVCKYIEVDKNGKLKNFKVFIIMDTDDCDSKTLKLYKSKNLFTNHWLKPYIVPIYNSPNLDSILRSLSYPIDTNNKADSYQKIFPGKSGDSKSFLRLKERITELDTQHSNMIKMIDYLSKYI